MSPVSAATSAGVGVRSSRSARRSTLWSIELYDSRTWPGTRIVRPWSAMARPMAWRIHHVA